MVVIGELFVCLVVCFGVFVLCWWTACCCVLVWGLVARI